MTVVDTSAKDYISNKMDQEGADKVGNVNVHVRFRGDVSVSTASVALLAPDKKTITMLSETSEKVSGQRIYIVLNDLTFHSVLRKTLRTSTFSNSIMFMTKALLNAICSTALVGLWLNMYSEDTTPVVLHMERIDLVRDRLDRVSFSLQY